MPLFKLDDGRILEAKEFRILEEDDLRKVITEQEAATEKLRSFLATPEEDKPASEPVSDTPAPEADAPAVTSTPTATEPNAPLAPAPDAPAVPEEAPAPSPQPEPAAEQEQPQAAAEQPMQPPIVIN